MTDQIYNKMLHVSLNECKSIVKGRFGIKDITVIKNSGKAIPFDKLKRGDIVVYYTSKGYRHTAIWIGDGKIADCTSTRKPNIKYGAKSYKTMTIKVAIRYTGK